jgi:hypothetical protein
MTGRATLFVIAATWLGCAPATMPQPRPPDPEMLRALASARDELVRHANAVGLAVHGCAHGSAIILTTPGSRDASDDETLAVFKAGTDGGALMAFDQGIVSDDFGTCCGDREHPAPNGCLEVTLWEDAAVVATLPGWLARAPRPNDARVHMSVMFMPKPRPRCSEGEPDCGPVAYDRQKAHRPRPPGRRRVVDFGARAARHDSCHGDGECGFGCGCGGLSARATTCNLVYETRLSDAWCGCVDNQCR